MLTTSFPLCKDPSFKDEHEWRLITMRKVKPKSAEAFANHPVCRLQIDFASELFTCERVNFAMFMGVASAANQVLDSLVTR
jgi:hypothetical protein